MCQIRQFWPNSQEISTHLVLRPLQVQCKAKVVCLVQRCMLCLLGALQLLLQSMHVRLQPLHLDVCVCVCVCLRVCV